MTNFPALRRLILWVGLCASVAEPALAQTANKLPATIHLAHVAEGKWRVDYEFSEPITALEFSTVGDYRQTAWKVLTPAVRYQAGDNTEAYIADQPMQRLSLEVSAYGQFEPKNYAPNNRFSDGGAAVYMGFFVGSVRAARPTAPERELDPTATYQGLGDETVIPPPRFQDKERSLMAYAYFGPQKPVQAGIAKLIMDPALPTWAAELILDTGNKMSTYFSKTYQRPLLRELVLMISVADLESSGLSMKGGATNGQITYRMAGRALAQEKPELRAVISRLVTHEMAHIWQENVSAGGIGPEAPWIHEGGAEAMAMDALLHTGIWSADRVVAYQDKARQECERVKDTPEAYQYAYACGLQNFLKLPVSVPLVWRALVQESEKTGQTYSESMVERVSQRLAR